MMFNHTPPMRLYNYCMYYRKVCYLSKLNDTNQSLFFPVPSLLPGSAVPGFTAM